MQLTREAMHGYLSVRGLVALAPEYGPDGENGCRLYFKDGGSRWLHKSVEAFKDKMYEFYRIDRAARKADDKALLGGREMLPVWLHTRMVLMPCKMRTSVLIDSDGYYGEVNLFFSTAALTLRRKRFY